MKNIARTIEVVANVAIILVAILLGFVLISRFVIAPRVVNKEPALAAANQLSGNSKISVDGVNWATKSKTLVLAISSTCHFCTESAAFYRQVASAHDGVQLVALLPQKVEEGKKYVSQLGFEVDEVIQAPLNSINVNGTPTLLLVNREGTVIGTWVGKLPANQEAEVLASLRTGD